MSHHPLRLAIVMDHPAQQFTRGLQLLSAEPDLDLQVHYWSAARRVLDHGFGREISWDVDLLGGYSSAEAPSSAFVLARMLRFMWGLHRDRPDVVICYGWASWIARAAILYCAFARPRLLMYGDTTWQHSSRGKRNMAQSAVLRLVLRACSGAVATGTFNREFYIASGMSPGRIFPGVCPADTAAFGQASLENRGLAAAGESGGEASVRPLRIGFAGKLIARKGADILLQAAALLPPSLPWSVTLVGDGPLMAELQALAEELGVTGRVSFPGFANTTEMPKILSGFDVLVVPSRLDMRVLVTIEAMAAGAALVVSDATAVWGPGDLVQEGMTGLVHASGDPADLARQLSRLLEDPGLLVALRRQGARRAADFGPEAFARTMAAASRRACGQAPIDGSARQPDRVG